MEIPVVAFDNDGAPEVVIDGETGRLVRFNDIVGLARAIEDLAELPETRLQLGQAGRQRCLDMFDHRTMVNRLEAVYEELLT